MMKKLLIATMLMMLIGCDFHGHGQTYVVHKTTPTSNYTPAYETVVVVEEVYVCEPVYDPTPSYPYDCIDYGVGYGYCCMYDYSGWDYYCQEEWCWWEDLCYWDNTYTACYPH
jgi:hypothetical protein